MNKIVAIALAAIISTNAMAAKIIDRPVPAQPSHQEIPALQAVNTDFGQFVNEAGLNLQKTANSVGAPNPKLNRIAGERKPKTTLKQYSRPERRSTEPKTQSASRKSSNQPLDKPPTGEE